jgi:perosamine synthetase
MDFKVGEKPRGAILGQEEIDAVTELLRGNESLSYDGRNIPAFEKEFAEYCGVKHAITMANATVALYVASQLLRLREGDEVIIGDITFKATVCGMLIKKCRLVYVDTDETLNIDPKKIEEKITDRTRAIYVIDMHGNPVDIDPIMKIAAKHNIKVVIDAAHSPGAEYKGRKVGSLGDITCFSFHSLKNMTCGGEGGMLTTNDDVFAEEARELRTMGFFGTRHQRIPPQFGTYQKPEFDYRDHSDGGFDHYITNLEEIGLNFRLTDIQAAIGRVQLRKLDNFNERRIVIARRYSDGIARIKGYRLWQPTPNSKCVYHLYPVFINQEKFKVSRDTVAKFLQEERGIEMILRFFPLHLSRYVSPAEHGIGECPVCERIFFEELLNLPISASMTFDEVDYVLESLKIASERFCK